MQRSTVQKDIRLVDWKLCLCPNSRVDKESLSFTTPEEIERSGLELFPAAVPGNFELDLIRAGKLPEDIFAGTNVLKLQDLECMHLWYFTRFEIDVDGAGDGCEGTDVKFDEPCLRFEGIDTVSEIYVDGALLGRTENMLIAHEFPLRGIASGIHSLVVHIIPVSVYARQFELPARCWAMKYTQDSLAVRKAPSMYGWDIMPRALSGGLWRPVTLTYRPRQRISSFYLVTADVETASDGGNTCNRAGLVLKAKTETDFDDLRDLTLTVRGVHRDRYGRVDSRFEKSDMLWSANHVMQIGVDGAVFWWPKNYGDPALYDVELILSRTARNDDGSRAARTPETEAEIFDRVTFRHGIRTVELERTSLAGPDGKFLFRVNGKDIFVLGTNWVPADVFPSRIDDRTIRGLELAGDLGCNMIRCWGGGPYPSHLLYDYCDEHGIMVWQDFAMACGLYPDDLRMQELVRVETISVVKEFRGHASLALWSGDNENDIFCQWRGGSVNGRPINRVDPNSNRLTREVIAGVVERHDGFRPYLPSSPYMDEKVFATGRLPAEDHLWGPRDFFKGEFYYDQSICHFASETGYHGCPSPATLRSFLSEEALENRGDGTVCTDPEWLVHSASMETDPGAPFAYRVPLMTRQVERLFGTAPADIATYALESQISQAEAMKFFIEHFRIGKWYRSGIIWWNVIDGWPQVSDAIVDWYGRKKLAYEYIKRSQQPFCLMCDEPGEDGLVTLVAASDLHEPLTVTYAVTDGLTGEKILNGETRVEADCAQKLARFRALPGHFYLLKWNSEGGGKDGSGAVKGLNHFAGDIGAGVNLSAYKAFMQNSGLWEKLEGF